MIIVNTVNNVFIYCTDQRMSKFDMFCLHYLFNKNSDQNDLYTEKRKAVSCYKSNYLESLSKLLYRNSQ